MGGEGPALEMGAKAQRWKWGAKAQHRIWVQRHFAQGRARRKKSPSSISPLCSWELCRPAALGRGCAVQSYRPDRVGACLAWRHGLRLGAHFGSTERNLVSFCSAGRRKFPGASGSNPPPGHELRHVLSPEVEGLLSLVQKFVTLVHRGNA
jgi:hypothetical protein